MSRDRNRVSQTGLTAEDDIEVEMKQYQGDASIIGSGDGRQGGGCFVTYVWAFIIVLGACALAAIVGVIVGLAHPALNQSCPDPPPTPDADQLWKQCTEMAWDKGECLPGLVCTSSVAPGTTTTPKPTGPPPDIRLPTTMEPTHYNLRLRPDIYTNDPSTFTFQGWVDIYMDCLQATRTIVLHTKLLTRSKLELREQGSSSTLDIFDITEDPKTDFLTIVTKDDLEAGKKYVVSVEYTGPITNDLKGIYYSSYIAGDKTKYLLTSQIQPINARKVFPCFDEPALKASYNISMERKPPLLSMSNTNIIKEETLADGWMRDSYATTPRMSAYLLAFIVSDFECIPSNTTDGKPAAVCSRPEVISQADFAASIAGKLQSFFEGYHAIDIPVPKMDHAGVPDFSFGAMENWGLIIYRESRLLYDPDSSTANAKQRVAAIVSHELAHMWFGNLVTPLWWDDVWLNEGFASYFEAVGVDNVFPSWQMLNFAIREDLMRAFPVDSLVTSHPIYQKVDNPADISQIFDTITYSKGASVIRMMKHFLGEDTFRWGLSKYLKDNAYKGTDHKQLFQQLTEQAIADGKPDINVTSIMNTWILQTGFPVVEYKYDVTSGQVTLSQNRFLFDPTLAAEADNPLWEVPISIVGMSPSGQVDWTNPTLDWLKQQSGSVDVSAGSKWILGNVKFQYYYRVNYDGNNWQALQQQLMDDHTKIDVANRVQIVDDSFNLARPGIVDQLLPMNMSQYLQQEADFLPWTAADKGFHYLDIMFDLTPTYGLLKQYIQGLVSNVYTSVGWQDEEGQEHLLRMLRDTALSMACHYGLRNCTSTAHSLYLGWMDHGVKIAAGIQPLVLCQGIKHGGDEEWDYAFEQYVAADSATLSKSLLQALACTREDWRLRRILALAIEEKVIRRQNFVTAVASVAKNPIGRRLSWEFLNSNWDIIFQRFGDMTFTFADIIESITEKFSTQQELDELLQFIETHPDLGTAQEAFKHTVESTRANIDWRRANEDKIFTWLANVV